MCIILAVSVFSIALEKQSETHHIYSVPIASQFWTDFLLSLNVVIQLNVLSASVFEEGNRLSVRWILPRDGALWALTYGTGPRLV